MLTLMDDLTGEHADCFFELLSFVATEFKRVHFFFFNIDHVYGPNLCPGIWTGIISGLVVMLGVAVVGRDYGTDSENEWI